jgi:hypothetical protein
MDGTVMTAKADCLASSPHDTHIASPARKKVLLAEAVGLINPRSDLANDYLNHFNEVLLLIENLPVLLPEMVDELVTWQPRTYIDYFRQSPLPGGWAAIELYENYLDDHFRHLFETCIERINALALKSIQVIGNMRDEDGAINSEDVELFCQEASGEMRAAIEVASDLVNNGMHIPSETPQGMADRILANFAQTSSEV